MKINLFYILNDNMVVYRNIKFLYFMFLCLVNFVLLVIIELILLVDIVLVGLFFI